MGFVFDVRIERLGVRHEKKWRLDFLNRFRATCFLTPHADAWKKSQSKTSEGNPALADLWPEYGNYPGGPGASTISPLGNDEVLSMSKAAETEIIHGRWAMLAVTGVRLSQ